MIDNGYPHLIVLEHSIERKVRLLLKEKSKPHSFWLPRRLDPLVSQDTESIQLIMEEGYISFRVFNNVY